MFILHNDYHIIDTFKSERGAKASFTRKWKTRYPQAEILSSVEFYKTEPTVVVRNLMSGKPVTIRKSEYGGCCDPSTERYWCM